MTLHIQNLSFLALSVEDLEALSLVHRVMILSIRITAKDEQLFEKVATPGRTALKPLLEQYTYKVEFGNFRTCGLELTLFLPPEKGRLCCWPQLALWPLDDIRLPLRCLLVTGNICSGS